MAGDVNIWIIQKDTFPLGENLLTIIEDTARISEDFMQVPFPTTDIILAVDTEIGGAHWRTHMTLPRNRWNMEVKSVPHETAHYYFYSHFGPPWFYEGMAQLIESFFNDLIGENMADRRNEVSMDMEYCTSDGRENIRHSEYIMEHFFRGWGPGGCTYNMGENFLFNIFYTIGEEAMSDAMRELYLSHREYLENRGQGQRATEEAIYRAFLKHTPPDKKEAFLDVYRRLHGGAFAFDKVPFDDDHADEAGLATRIVVGESVGGVLDYMFDYDYFTFQAEEWQKYRITVNHESLGFSSVTLYDPDGLTRGRWKSRTREATGPQMLWVAPSSDAYYFAVQNFGGKTGTYTLRITPVIPRGDDHGDTPATATPISLGEVIHGTVDDNFDYDYFQFQAIEGKNYRIVTMIGTLEYYHQHLYTSDGVRHDGSSRYPIVGYDWDSVWGMRQKSRRWTAPSSGPSYLAIDGAYGSTGSYIVTITPVDDDSDD